MRTTRSTVRLPSQTSPRGHVQRERHFQAMRHTEILPYVNDVHKTNYLALAKKRWNQTFDAQPHNQSLTQKRQIAVL